MSAATEVDARIGGMRARQHDQSDSVGAASFRELRLLEEVGSTPEVTQRGLALRVNVALGVVNLLVRTLVKKGFIKARRVGWKQWTYIVTPAGVVRRVQLTVAYVERFLEHYRRVRTILRRELEISNIDTDSRVAIYGTTDLAELMFLALRDSGIVEIDFFDQDGQGAIFLGSPVRNLESIVPDRYAVVMVAFSGDVQSRWLELDAQGVLPSQYVAPLQGSVGGRSRMER